MQFYKPEYTIDADRHGWVFNLPGQKTAIKNWLSRWQKLETAYMKRPYDLQLTRLNVDMYERIALLKYGIEIINSTCTLRYYKPGDKYSLVPANKKAPTNQ